MNGRADASSAWQMLVVVSLAQFLGMTLWFSATAITPALIAEFDIAPTHAAWLTMAVQAGFVAGTLIFSGSLYLLALTGQRWLGAVTPLGGLAFILGWAALAWAALRG